MFRQVADDRARAVDACGRFDETPQRLFVGLCVRRGWQSPSTAHRRVAGLPVADLAAGLDGRGPIMDRLHVRRLLQSAFAGSSAAAFVPVGAAGAQRLLICDDDQAAVDGLVDCLEAEVPAPPSRGRSCAWRRRRVCRWLQWQDRDGADVPRLREPRSAANAEGRGPSGVDRCPPTPWHPPG